MDIMGSLDYAVSYRIDVSRVSLKRVVYDGACHSEMGPRGPPVSETRPRVRDAASRDSGSDTFEIYPRGAA